MSSSSSDPVELPPQVSTRPLANRSRGWNVHIYDAKDTTTMLGGLFVDKGITNANFYSMVEILLIFIGTFFLRDEGDAQIEKDDHPLRPGKYYIIATNFFMVSDEPWLLRTISLQTGTRTQAFRDAVRSRDRQCVISGEEVPSYGGEPFYMGFEAAHIFPLAHEGHWIDKNYGCWITIPSEKGGAINSLQNGLLLRGDIHQLFDSYNLSINPDDNYKIVLFIPDSKGLIGRRLNQELLNDPRRPVDQLLRWHFRQAVLANMRGAGEPIFEHDFPPGSDIVGDILYGPKAAERMEFELFSRLGAQVELFPAAGQDGVNTPR